jgi:hypothetical protein
MAGRQQRCRGLDLNLFPLSMDKHHLHRHDFTGTHALKPLFGDPFHKG